MHNNIMAAGSKDRPPMLGPGRYSQWRSRFLRYIDTKPNGEGLKKCILNGPYVPTSVLIQAVPAAEGRPAVQQHTAIETVRINVFLTYNTSNEMWIAIERLQQGESLNVQDVKTNLFWEFGKFTSRDGESMESYYSRFYKLMNELTRNNLQVTTMQEVHDIRAERIAKSANPLATHCGSSTIFNNLLQHQNPKDQMQHSFHKTKDKEMIKNLALLAKYFKKLYQTYNNNLRTSPNSRKQRLKILHQAGSQVVQQTGIQCFNCKGYGHYAKESEAKAVKATSITRKKMMRNWNHITATLQRLGGLTLKNPVLLSDHWTYKNHDESNVYDNVRRHSEQPESINDTYVLKKDDSNVTPDSSNICTNDNQVDQNAAECVDERVALANLIANLTLDTEENKMILKQLKKANASLTQELEKCKTNLDETNSALGEAISCRDSCLIALQNKQNEFDKYKAF
ncbi:hypothetical protein Tco_0019485 [Tanacetum coccineum]